MPIGPIQAMNSLSTPVIYSNDDYPIQFHFAITVMRIASKKRPGKKKVPIVHEQNVQDK